MALGPPSTPANSASHASHGRPRSGSNASSSWGGLSSMLRPAASERRAANAHQSWWSGMSRVLRAAGSNPHARPLHAVLAGGQLAPDEGLRGR